MHVIYLFIFGLLNCGFGGNNASRGGIDQIQLHVTRNKVQNVWDVDPWGDRSLLYFAYTCVRDLFIEGLFTLQK
jgi:hypothetical protein